MVSCCLRLLQPFKRALGANMPTESYFETQGRWDRLLKTAADATPYAPDAFRAISEVVAECRLEIPGQMDAAYLCGRIRDRAFAAFGKDAQSQLAEWGIRSTEDIGKVVYLMIETGLIEAIEEDSRAEFHEVFDFESEFGNLELPKKERPRIQWRLSTLFLITTGCAIAFAGFGSRGVQGAFGTVISSGLAFLGFYFILQGVRKRSLGWIAAIGLGFLLAFMGCWTFFMLILDRGN